VQAADAEKRSAESVSEVSGPPRKLAGRRKCRMFGKLFFCPGTRNLETILAAGPKWAGYPRRKAYDLCRRDHRLGTGKKSWELRAASKRVSASKGTRL